MDGSLCSKIMRLALITFAAFFRIFCRVSLTELFIYVHFFLIKNEPKNQEENKLQPALCVLYVAQLQSAVALGSKPRTIAL
ncbi:hypothetical protein CRYO30217_01791 [Parvicella tangerina]|uniref:Uncharacterized protein n=1 Tax=Parvicella tangerina TaxID=2829795 RepID=A0A916NBZ9_9FLAO|nr:hypothetical protein CRYO30217_01791 [Parvicella tangerina]